MAESGVSKYKWLIGPLITLIMVAGGLVVSWTTTKAAVAEMQKDVAKMEQKAENLENKIHDIELKTAVDSSILQSLQSDVTEIKKDVKKLLEH